MTSTILHFTFYTKNAHTTTIAHIETINREHILSYIFAQQQQHQPPSVYFIFFFATTTTTLSPQPTIQKRKNFIFYFLFNKTLISILASTTTYKQTSEK